jgi:hypothetical protein
VLASAVLGSRKQPHFCDLRELHFHFCYRRKPHFCARWKPTSMLGGSLTSAICGSRTSVIGGSRTSTICGSRCSVAAYRQSSAGVGRLDGQQGYNRMPRLLLLPICAVLALVLLSALNSQQPVASRDQAVQALGKVPVGHAGGRQCPMWGSWCWCVWSRDERERRRGKEEMRVRRSAPFHVALVLYKGHIRL